MRNLLLEKDKKKIRQEYAIRLAAVALLFAFVAVLLGSIFLLPSFFLSNAKKQAMEERRDIIEQSIAVREQEASLTTLTDANEKLLLLSPPSDTVSLLELLTVVVEAQPSGISIREFFYTARNSDDGNNELRLSGVAERRENLLAFQNALRKKPIFSSVTLPVSNLAADQNISFSLNLIGSF